MTWQQAWREGRIPWDAGASPPALQSLLGSIAAEGGVLVPGCGAGYDVITLARAGFRAVGVDLADGASARFDELRRAAGVASESATFVVADYFELQAPPQYDALWDYTFFCALPPAERPRWAAKAGELVTSGGELWSLQFPVVPGASAEQGPPHPVDPEETTRLLAPWFARISLERVAESHPGREGKEWLARFRRR